MTTPFQLLTVSLSAEIDAADLAVSGWGPFEVTACAGLDAAAAHLRSRHADAVLVGAGTAEQAEALVVWPALSHALLDAAVLVVATEPTPALATRLLSLGVQDIHSPASGVDTLARSLRLAIERKRINAQARKSHATDLSTGLPNHAQLLEHMTHLLALREREPAPMALLVLRVDGLATTHAALGMEAANVLRRKVGVRLRAGLRASDVVASIGNDSFAVLLAWIDDSADGLRVAAKLAQALQRPFSVAGRGLGVAVSAGVSLYPEHGKDADTLLRLAVGQAASQAASGRVGFANFAERGRSVAANDDESPV